MRLRAIRSERAPGILAAGLVAVAVAAAFHAGGVLDRAEYESVDARFSVRGERPADDLTVVAIDEQTFASLDGTWPLKRTAHRRSSTASTTPARA